MPASLRRSDEQPCAASVLFSLTQPCLRIMALSQTSVMLLRRSSSPLQIFASSATSHAHGAVTYDQNDSRLVFALIRFFRRL